MQAPLTRRDAINMRFYKMLRNFYRELHTATQKYLLRDRSSPCPRDFDTLSSRDTPLKKSCDSCSSHIRPRSSKEKIALNFVIARSLGSALGKRFRTDDWKIIIKELTCSSVESFSTRKAFKCAKYLKFPLFLLSISLPSCFSYQEKIIESINTFNEKNFLRLKKYS